MGKNYANRKKKENRPKSDFYATPISLTWELLKLNIFDTTKTILEPACGDYAISSILKNKGFNVIEKDLRYGDNFYKETGNYDYIITNPPFSEFDQFVIKAKSCCNKFAFIAKSNFFGAYQRYEAGIWKHLKNVYIFNRQIDYRSSYNENGYFYVGNLITGWFIWDMNWHQNYWQTSIIDVNKYAKLGAFKENKIMIQDKKSLFNMEEII